MSWLKPRPTEILKVLTQTSKPALKKLIRVSFRSDGSGDAIEAKSGVPLFQEARALQAGEALGEFDTRVVLGDHDSTRRDEMRTVEIIENAPVTL